MSFNIFKSISLTKSKARITNKLMSNPFVISLVLFFIFGTVEVSASTYYVSPAGSDSSNGSEGAPFKTIQNAADIVNPGDTVIVKDGIYTDDNADNFIIWISKSGSAGNWITFKAENKWGAVLDGQNFTGGYYAVGFNTNTHHVRFEDFEIKEANIGFFSNAGAHDLYFYRNHIYNMGESTAEGDGMYLAAGTTNVTIDSNVIHDIGSGANQEHGIYIKGGGGHTIINNIIYNCGHGWAVHFFGGSVTNVDIINNIFAFPNPNQPGAIIMASPISNLNIINNIFCLNNTAGIYNFSSSLTNISIANNLSTNALLNANALIQSPTSNFSITGNITNTDPLLVDTVGSTFDSFDFHLQSNSPAIDAGIATNVSSFDHDGNSRIQGSGIDIGAYEQVSGSPDTEAPSVPANNESGQSAPSQATTAGETGETGETILPTITSVNATAVTNVTVIFSEPVEQTSAETTANYAIDQGIIVNAALLGSDLQTVTLTTSTLSEGITYALTINNVRDRASVPNTISSNSQETFTFTSALVAHWNLDEALGQTISDSSGNSNNGNLGSNNTVEDADPIRVAGKFNNGLQFDGINDLVTISNTSTLNSLTSFTYTAWIHPTGFGEGGGFGRIISKESTATFDDVYFLVNGTAGNTFGLSISNSAGTEFSVLASANSITLNTWQHVAVTYDNSGDRKAHLYLNGNEVAYQSQVPVTGTMKLTANPIIIGNNASGSRSFQGVIDESKIYNRALSATEIQNDFVNQSPTNDFAIPNPPSGLTGTVVN